MEREVWKTVENFPYYKVSSLGRIKSCKFKIEKLLVGGIDKYGYKYNVLCHDGRRKTYKLHVIIMKTFVNNDDPKNKTQINHIDGNKLNNRLDNLEYSTPGDNVRHARRLGLINSPKGEDHSNSKLTDDNVKEILKLLKSKKYTQKEIANEFNVSRRTVGFIKNNQTWKHIKR